MQARKWWQLQLFVVVKMSPEDVSDLLQSPPYVALEGCKSKITLGVIPNCSPNTIVASAPAYSSLVVKHIPPP